MSIHLHHTFEGIVGRILGGFVVSGNSCFGEMSLGVVFLRGEDLGSPAVD